jgi:hypothetical protein
VIGRVLRIRYEVTQALGEGPVFSQYVAKDRVSGREVRLRTLRPLFAEEREFVDAIGEIVAKHAAIKHPGVERLTALDDDDGLPFVVSEYSESTSLTERIRRFAPFSVPVALSIGVSIGEALSAVHQAGIVHGDLGSHNVALTQSGDARIQLAGVWEAYSRSRSAGAMVLGSMAPYLAPEVSKGSMPTVASDIYALGVILFQLLTGRLPFLAEQPVAMAIKHSTEPVPSLRVLNASVPVALQDVVRKALAKEPEDRYSDVDAMVSDLRIIQDGLRFGKSVQVSAKDVGGDVSQPVAPAMGAIRGKSAEGRRFAAADSEDVPLWLKMALVFFLSIVTFMIGGWVIFNLNKPRTLLVPDVRRLSVPEAETRLRPLGLKVRVIRRESNEQVRAGVILSTDPSPGSKVVEGFTIGAVVSLGSRTVEVPDVRGVTVDEARAMLDSLGLKLSDRIVEERDRSVEPGSVIMQLPEPRTRVERGSQVRVTIATRAEPSRGSDPNDNIKYLYLIRIRLSDIDRRVLMRVDMTDSRGTKTVHDEEHEPGEQVEIAAEGFGAEVVFRIFYDGELVKQVTKRADEEGVPVG